MQLWWKLIFLAFTRHLGIRIYTKNESTRSLRAFTASSWFLCFVFAPFLSLGAYKPYKRITKSLVVGHNATLFFSFSSRFTYERRKFTSLGNRNEQNRKKFNRNRYCQIPKQVRFSCKTCFSFFAFFFILHEIILTLCYARFSTRFSQVEIGFVAELDANTESTKFACA